MKENSGIKIIYSFVGVIWHVWPLQWKIAFLWYFLLNPIGNPFLNRRQKGVKNGLEQQ